MRLPLLYLVPAPPAGRWSLPLQSCSWRHCSVDTPAVWGGDYRVVNKGRESLLVTLLVTVDDFLLFLGPWSLTELNYSKNGVWHLCHMFTSQACTMEVIIKFKNAMLKIVPSQITFVTFSTSLKFPSTDITSTHWMMKSLCCISSSASISNSKGCAVKNNLCKISSV